MARKKKNNVSSFKLLLVVIFINFCMYMVFSNTNMSEYLGEPKVTENNALIDVYHPYVDGDLTIHYIDVGQGDAILINESGKYMLIDAGPTSAKNSLDNYLKAQGVKELEYVIVTHAHEDHIGSMSMVIKNYDIKNFMMSKYISTSKTYENLILAAKEKEIQFYAPTIGEKFNLGATSFTILADGNFNSDNMNNHSIVIRLEHGENSFLFMADAEEELELKIMNNNLEFKSDVIKVGHHGSDASTSISFLKAVNPKYAVISLGKNNAYGHPCKSVMNSLRNLNIPVYRTDESSNVVLKSDGKNIKFNVGIGSYTYISGN